MTGVVSFIDSYSGLEDHGTMPRRGLEMRGLLGRRQGVSLPESQYMGKSSFPSQGSGLVG